MLFNVKIIEIYFIKDEFSKEFNKTITVNDLNKNDAPKRSNLQFNYTHLPM